MTSRERIIDLVTQITVARAQLQRLEADLDQLLPAGGAGAPTPRRAGRAPRGSLARRVLQLLEAAPDQLFAVPEVAKRLGVSSVPSLRKTVLRLAAQRKIERRHRGAYGAARQQAAATQRRAKRGTRARRSR